MTRRAAMHARLSIDIAWSDLGFAVLAAGFARSPARRARRVETCFARGGDAFAALSARSGFDAYLRALALPADSEVLVSGLTIPHMVQILAAHGLRAVPFALDPATLAPAAGELERHATPRTRAVLFAHLFGERADLDPLVHFARRRGLLVWEDCAQAYTGDAWRGHPAADVALFSFGLIKTGTAIQGGILRVRDAAVLARMRALAAAWPVQRRTDFVRRAAKAAVLRGLGQRWIFARFARACGRSGRDLDQLLHAATRGFPGPDFLLRLRRAPSAPLLALLERRLRRPHASEAERRRALGEALLAELGETVEVYGRGARERHHWVFVVGCDEPAHLVRTLRAAGFDATARSSLVPVERDGAVSGAVPNRADSNGADSNGADSNGDGAAATAASRTLLERCVYVPLALHASRAELAELVRIVRAASRVRTVVPAARASLAAPLVQPPAG